MTTTINEIEFLELIDFDATIGCDYRTPSLECTEEAKWIIINKCCGKQRIRCTEHKDNHVKYILQCWGIYKGVRCGGFSPHRARSNPGCGAIIYASNYENAFTVREL